MNERSIFLEALEKNDPSDRTAFLDNVCAGDQALRQRIESLLKSHLEAGSFLGKLAPERVAEELANQPTADETQANALESNQASDDLGFLTPSEKPDAHQSGCLKRDLSRQLIRASGYGIRSISATRQRRRGEPNLQGSWDARYG